MKGILVLVGSAIVGNYVAERFVLKAPGGTTGFVEVADGFGLDDVARAATIAGVILLARKFIG